MSKYKFTIFTPCYNSENIIERVFNSLQAQTFTDFEWIVVDDCSKDKTREIIEKLIPKATFPVKYIKNETNQMVAKNHEIGLDNAEGFLFIKLSHDDALIPQGLENFNKAWENLTAEQKDKLAGVVCNCVDKEGNIEGTLFPQSPWIADDFEMRFQHKIKGEKCSAHKTEILKKWPFYRPEIDVYIPEDLHYFTQNFEYQNVYSNDAARIHITGEDLHVYLESQMGRGKKFVNGFAYYYSGMVNQFHSKIWKYDKKAYLFYMINYVRYSRYAEKPYTEIIKGAKAHHWLVYPSIVLGNINELIKHKNLL